MMYCMYVLYMYMMPARVLYWDAISHFPDELQRLVEVMEERELRIRAPLEEVQLLLEATTTVQSSPDHGSGVS